MYMVTAALSSSCVVLVLVLVYERRRHTQREAFLKALFKQREAFLKKAFSRKRVLELEKELQRSQAKVKDVEMRLRACQRELEHVRGV